MSPRVDGSLPQGSLWVKIPGLKGNRLMTFLGFRLMTGAVKKRPPRLVNKRPPRVERTNEHREAWQKVNRAFAKWQGEMERKYGAREVTE